MGNALNVNGGRVGDGVYGVGVTAEKKGGSCGVVLCIARTQSSNSSGASSGDTPPRREELSGEISCVAHGDGAVCEMRPPPPPPSVGEGGEAKKDAPEEAATPPLAIRSSGAEGEACSCITCGSTTGTDTLLPVLRLLRRYEEWLCWGREPRWAW